MFDCSLSSDFNFHQTIFSIPEVHYSITFKVVFVSVMEYVTIQRLTVNPEIPDA